MARAARSQRAGFSAFKSATISSEARGHIVGQPAECPADELIAQIGNEPAEIGIGEFATDRAVGDTGHGGGNSGERAPGQGERQLRIFS